MPRKIALRTNSNSLTQRQAEAIVLDRLNANRPLKLQPKRLRLHDRTFTVDGYADQGDEVEIVEIWAHVGPAKAAQKNKVLADTLKLATLTRLIQQDRPTARVECSVVFVDDAAAQVLRNQSWGALAAELLGVRTDVIAISDELRQMILAAQRTQDLRYTPDAEESSSDAT